MSTGIPSVSPELGTEEECSDTFFINDIGCIVRTLDAQYPLVKTTFKKIGSQIDIHGTKFNSNQANLKISNKGLSTASDTWITLNSSSKFNLEAVNAYDPFTYDKDPRGKKIELSLKKLSNEEFSHVIQIPKLHSRRYLNIELIGDMKDVKSLDFSYKEYNTDVSMKKQTIAVPEKSIRSRLMSMAQLDETSHSDFMRYGIIVTCVLFVLLGAFLCCVKSNKCQKKSDTVPTYSGP